MESRPLALDDGVAVRSVEGVEVGALWSKWLDEYVEWRFECEGVGEGRFD
jgi:hypothetical protein